MELTDMPRVQQKQRKPPDLSVGIPVDLDAERFVLGSVLLDAPRHLPSVRARLNGSIRHACRRASSVAGARARCAG